MADFDESLVEPDGSISFRLWADPFGDGLEPGSFMSAMMEEGDSPPPSTAPAPFPKPGPPAAGVPTPPHPALPPYGQVPGKGGKPAPTLGIVEIPWNGGTTGVQVQSGGKPTPPAGVPVFAPPDPATGIASGHAEGNAALIILYNKLPSGVVFINYPTGPCNYCLGNIYKILPQGATLTIVWTDPKTGKPTAVKITGGTDPKTGKPYPRVPVSPAPTPQTK